MSSAPASSSTLRSRSNRAQGPSESTDEGSGRGKYPYYHQSSSGSIGSYGSATNGYGNANGSGFNSYGGSPSNQQSNPPPPPSPSPYASTPAPKPNGYYGGYAPAYSNPGPGVCNGPAVPSSPSYGSGFVDAGASYGGSSPKENPYQKGNKKMSGSGSSGGGRCCGLASILVPLTLVLLMALGGATFYFRQAMLRTQVELSSKGSSSQFTGGRAQRKIEEDGDDDDDAGISLAAARKDAAIAASDRTKLTVEMTRLKAENERLKSVQSSLQSSGESTGKSSELMRLKAENERLKKTQTTLKSNVDSTSVRIREFETLEIDLKNQLQDANDKAHLASRDAEEYKAMAEGREELEQLVERREDRMWDKIKMLTDKISRESRREAEEWFGPGPHKVSMEIEYPLFNDDGENVGIHRGSIIIEMASLEIMPHSVNLFLQQVHHKLWDGCSFVINAMHILQAGPHAFDDEGEFDANAPDLVGKFRDARLDKVSFQEYSPEMPHTQWTVGFAGRPGGPDFYINKIDNSVNHGPGGQEHQDLHEEADPCFGKVVEGLDVLNEISRIPADRARDMFLSYPVTFVAATVISMVNDPMRNEPAQSPKNNNWHGPVPVTEESDGYAIPDQGREVEDEQIYHNNDGQNRVADVGRVHHNDHAEEHDIRRNHQ